LVVVVVVVVVDLMAPFVVSRLFYFAFENIEFFDVHRFHRIS